MKTVLYTCGLVLAIASATAVSKLLPNEKVGAASVSSSCLRKFYLTTNTVAGDAATRSCASGYHMASIWEVSDVGILQYDKTLGLTSDDSGMGPPANGMPGWIRTGNNAAFSDPSSGFANCSAWTSNSPNGTGAAIRLNMFWNWDGSGPMPLDVKWAMNWQLFLNGPGKGPPPCNTYLRVWCVQD
jgi:hypothetical protein